MRKTIKILVSSLLVLCMLLPMATTAVFAAGSARSTPSVYTGEKNNAEDWTKQDWIDNFAENETNLTIDSAYELVTFAQASGSITFTDDTVVTVTTDIVLNEGDSKDWVLDQTGLFAFPGITNFVGTFDGNGKSVSGVYMKHSGTSNNSYDGFFKILASGTTTIKDYAIVNSYFTTSLSAYAATFICRINSTASVTLSGLYSNAIVVNNYADDAGNGGIVSLISSNEGYTPNINGCVFDGYVLAGGNAGGIVGLVANYQAYFSANVSDCANLGTLSGGTVGGIVAKGRNLTINNCINYTGEALVGTMSSETISGDVNYVFAGQKVDGTEYYTGAAVEISEANLDEGAYDLEALDFVNTWTVRASDYPLPKSVVENFGDYIGTLGIEYDDPNATVSYYTGFKNNADDWTSADWKANYAAGGEYTIDSAYELMTFTAAGLTFKADATVKLTKDIVINQGNAEDWRTTAPQFNWKPIADFQGTFDGQGHTVSGIYMTSSATFDGFFQKIKNANIMNFGLVNSYVYSTGSYVGGMIGRVNYSSATITDCYTDAIVVSTNSFAGGFIGLSNITYDTDDKTVIERCVFAGRVEGPTHTGGFVGYGQISSGASPVEFIDCANIGMVKKGSSSSGAFASSVSDLTLTRCVNYGYAAALAGKVSNEDRTDGKAAVATVSDCYLISDYAQTVFATAPAGFEEADVTTTVSVNNILADAKNTLKKLDFESTWTVAENGFALPKVVCNYFADEISWEDVDESMFAAEYNAIGVRWYAGYKADYDAALTAYTAAIEAGDTVFYIATAGEFAAIANLINGGKFANNASGITFKLTDDITFNAGQDATYMADYAPAFTWTPIDPFRGEFDGQGHTISGIYYKGGASTNYKGLFGVLNAGATVKNFGVLNSYVSMNYQYGSGIIGRINATGVTVKGIYSEMIVESNVGNGTGGIIGLISNTGTDSANPTYAVIEDCVFAGTINSNGSGQAGGIVGQSANYQYCLAVIKNCANYGTINSNGAAGAIIGMTANVMLDKCLNAGDVFSVNYDSDALVGAFAGSNGRTLVVNNCYNWIETAISDAATYTGDEYTAPTVLTENDMGTAIFATGWSARNGYINESNDQYPLPTYIFENFFAIDVKYVQNTAVDNGAYSVRFTAEIDSLDFSKAGFKVTATVGGVTKTLNINTGVAFQTIKAGEGEGYAAITARDGRYYVAITLTDLPVEDTTFVVTPYTVGDAGEEVEGITKTITYSNGAFVSSVDAQ